MELPPRVGPLAAPPRRAALIAWLVALLALLPHLRGVGNGFVYDDFRFVAENGGVQTLARPHELLLSIERMSTPRDADIWRPLRTLGFALQHALGCDVDHAAAAAAGAPPPCRSAALYHATSLLLFLLLVRGLIELAQREAGLSFAAAAAGALLFGWHPLTVESVAWLSSQGDLLAALFVVATLAAAPTRPLLAVLLAALALLGKESALPLVGALLAQALRRDGARARKGTVVAVAAITLLYLVARQQLLGRALDFTASGFSQEGAPLPTRLLTTLRNALFALRLFVVPWPPSIDYDATSYTPALFFDSAPLVVGGALVLLLVALRIVRPSERPRAALVAPLLFAALFFAPTAGLFVVMKSPMADRYLLLPTAGAALFVAALAERLAERRAPAARAERPRVALLMVLLVGLPWGVLTWRRTGDYRDDATLWRAELLHHPRSLQGQLGVLHDAVERGDAAEQQRLAQAIVATAPPDDPRGWLAAFRLGQLAVTRGATAEAVGWFERCRAGLARRGHARGLAPELHLAFVGLANAARAAGEPAAAERLAREGIGWFGRQPRLLEALAIARDLQGDPAGAVALHREALASGAATASLCYHLALAYAHAGDAAAARAAALRALALDASHAGARRLLDELPP
ncbi:MAG: hypothetical protein JNL90_13285 [Planctomycetes bacterium]|nr:hypothetical protein [Planctomycetota bacterium]